MTIYSIYRATNKITNKVYIGFTSLGVDARRNKHENNALIKNIKCKFYDSIRKYSATYWTWETIYQSTDKHHTLNTMENFFIVEHDSFKNGYNSTLGGDGTSGRIISEEERETKRKAANKFYSSISEEERRSLFGKPGKENAFYNKTHTEESLATMRAGHKKQRAILIKCEICGVECDSQNYAKYHGDKCDSEFKGVAGRKWYHLNLKSFYLYPDDAKIKNLNLVAGRSPTHKKRQKQVKA